MPSKRIGRADAPQVDADLVVAARLRVAPPPARRGLRRVPSASGRCSRSPQPGRRVRRACAGRVLPLRAAWSGVSMRPSARLGHAGRECEVGLPDAAMLEGQAEFAVRLGRAREDDDAGDVPVEPMHHPEPAPIWRSTSARRQSPAGASGAGTTVTPAGLFTATMRSFVSRIGMGWSMRPCSASRLPETPIRQAKHWKEDAAALTSPGRTAARVDPRFGRWPRSPRTTCRNP